MKRRKKRRSDERSERDKKLYLSQGRSNDYEVFAESIKIGKITNETLTREQLGEQTNEKKRRKSIKCIVYNVQWRCDVDTHEKRIKTEAPTLFKNLLLLFGFLCFTDSSLLWFMLGLSSFSISLPSSVSLSHSVFCVSAFNRTENRLSIEIAGAISNIGKR